MFLGIGPASATVMSVDGEAEEVRRSAEDHCNAGCSCRRVCVAGHLKGEGDQIEFRWIGNVIPDPKRWD